MPTSLKNSAIFSARNSNFPSNASISNLEVAIFIGEKFNSVVFPPVEFQGNENDNIIGFGLALSSSDNNVGFRHVMNKIEFQGAYKKSESTVLLVDTSQIEISDSQNYVVAYKIGSDNLPFWN